MLKILSFSNFFFFFSKVTVTNQINSDKPCFWKSKKGINQHATTYWYLWYYITANNYLAKVNNKKHQNLVWNMLKVERKIWRCFMPCASVLFVDFEWVFAWWVTIGHIFVHHKNSKQIESSILKNWEFWQCQ